MSCLQPGTHLQQIYLKIIIHSYQVHDIHVYCGTGTDLTCYKSFLTGCSQIGLCKFNKMELCNPACHVLVQDVTLAIQRHSKGALFFY